MQICDSHYIANRRFPLIEVQPLSDQALGVADEVDDGHVGFNLLLLSDQIDTQSILAQSRFDTSQGELLRRSTSIGT
jgi:hypothetical protein